MCPKSSSSVVQQQQQLWKRYHEMLNKLARPCGASVPADRKNGDTELALIQIFGPDAPPAARERVMSLLTPKAAQFYKEGVRGMIAAGVSVLRCSPMKVAQIKQWLGKEIKRQGLDFEASHAIGWFRDCSNEKLRVSRGMLDAFCGLRPDPSQSVTEAEAKEWVTGLLNCAAGGSAGPLTRKTRGRG